MSMRNIIALLLVAFACLYGDPSIAQEKQKARVSQIQQKGNTVTMTVTSDGEFYIGGNVHVLHIGSKHYDLYDQDNVNGKGILKFYVPAGEFLALKNGTKMFLTYGEAGTDNELELEAFSKDKEMRCWALGKLNKKMTKANATK